MKYLITFFLLGINLAFAAPEVRYEILKEEQTLYGETRITAKCENGVVITVRCAEGKNQCGVDSKPLGTALERACFKVMPPATPEKRSR